MTDALDIVRHLRALTLGQRCEIALDLAERGVDCHPSAKQVRALMVRDGWDDRLARRAIRDEAALVADYRLALRIAGAGKQAAKAA